MLDQEERLRPGMPEIKPVLQRHFKEVSDFVMKSIRLGFNGQAVLISYLSVVVDEDKLSRDIIQPLILKAETIEQVESILEPVRLGSYERWEDINKGMWKGHVFLYLDGEAHAYLLNMSSWPSAQVKEPDNESTLKGTRSGFIDSNHTNLALIRHHIPEERLIQQEVRTGHEGKIHAVMLYHPDKADPANVTELNARLRRIDSQALMSMGELAESLEDNNYSMLPQLLLTERPDVVASGIMEGKIAILMGHTSQVMLAPMTFLSFFLSADDRNLRWPVVTFFRLLRFIGLVIAIFLPSFYIAAVSYHYEIIPIDLVLSVGKSLERVPVPPILEALFMELILEMLREASLRLPPKVGQSVGIVGGIVIGQAAVEAGLVSNVMVIVVALTAIASFVQPNQDMAAAVRLLRFPFMIAAFLMGLVGIVIGIMVLVTHIISMQSLKAPYGSPLFPIDTKKWRSVLARLPQGGFRNRADSAVAGNDPQADSSSRSKR
ncbi:spore germination protein [Paenibacillus nanensis]|uniref:Spore germination protein n=1 Tax=Paenibacillus nanensis TaxID=393251 RepID=A0A3A1VIR1_9BACL|nr:spore germination protein [Paenibacillus nanensis]RIX59506.1 spore germination protein [Paenibacillus nanensis]